ncbi:MAG: methyltransferase domain-containing protein [Candidatus Micrarchaeales archaeon]|nr:methyltransferase domain-containing protein [Candidatus Micrarchaeales archaeon]
MKINLGSGEKFVSDWINVDRDIRLYIGKRRPKNFKNYNLSRGLLPFKTESIDYIYTSHFLEHIKREKAEILTKECIRVLKPRGLIRIVVPDLDIFCNEWIKFKKTGNTDFFKSLDLVETPRPIDAFNRYFGNLYISNKGYFKSKISKLFFTRSLNKFGHKWFYDYDDLALLLNDAGFRNIKRHKYREGKCPDINQLDNRPLESLYVEAEK